MNHQENSDLTRNRKIAFFKFSKLELGGGCEKHFIELCNGLISIDPHLEISIITLGEKQEVLLNRLLTNTFFKDYSKVNLYRESSKAILDAINPKINYVSFDNFKDLKMALKEFDVVISKNEVLEAFVLKFIVGYKNLKKLIFDCATPISYTYATSLKDKIHNILYGKVIYGFLTSGVDAFRVLNSYDKLLLTDYGFKNVNLIYTPVELDKNIFNRRELIKPNTPFKILFIGRLTDQKGVDTVIETIHLLSKNQVFSNIEFTIAGSGDEIYLKLITDAAKQYKNVHYLGHVKATEANNLYHNTDLVFVPSRRETAFRIIFEAAQYGRFLLTSDIPTSGEFIIDNVTGYKIEINAEKYAKKILEIYNAKLNNVDSLNNMGIQSFNNIEEKLEHQKIYNQFHALITTD